MAFSPKPCSVDGCNNFANKAGGGAKGFCAKHYQRFRTHGDPLGGNTFQGEPFQFIEQIAVPFTGTECLIWPFSEARTSYPVIRINGVRMIVSRLVCELTKGPPQTNSLHAAHSCGKGHLGCVNPKHLSWKTPSENQCDRFAHGTSLRGERNSNTPLTEANVLEIRSLRGAVKQSDLAKRFGVSRNTIQNIQNGRTWGWLAQCL